MIRLENVLKTSWRRIAKTNILVLTKTSWRRLEDVFWSRKTKANIFVLMKTSWRRLLKTKTKGVFKTSSRRLHQDECLLGVNENVSLIDHAPDIWLSHCSKLALNQKNDVVAPFSAFLYWVFLFSNLVHGQVLRQYLYWVWNNDNFPFFNMTWLMEI